MAQVGKASIKRGKPSYFMSILGVTIVLFFIGIFGWLFLNAESYINKLKENVKVVAYLHDNAKMENVDSLKAYISNKPYTRFIEYVDKETAKKRFIAQGEADFSSILEENPLRASIEFNLKSNFVHKDTLESIRRDLINRPMVVESVDYPSAVVDKIGPVMKWILVGLVILAIIFSTLSIILIDNTIRLAMYSNRFLIKTMQMVGATRQFISRPMNFRAIINGTVAAIIAIVIIYGLVLVFEGFIPYLKDLRNTGKLIMLFFLLLIIGIGITVFSTNRSIIKYLKMKLDDLY
jgi:cell division transport system permease protein